MSPLVSLRLSTALRQGLLVLSLMFLGCGASQPPAAKQEADPLGYVVFSRNDSEDYDTTFRISCVHYGHEEYVGEIKDNKTPICVAVRPGINMFTILTENGKIDRETFTVTEGKVLPVEILVSWSDGYRFDTNIPYRWDVSHEKPERELADGECGYKSSKKENVAASTTDSKAAPKSEPKADTKAAPQADSKTETKAAGQADAQPATSQQSEDKPKDNSEQEQ